MFSSSSGISGCWRFESLGRLHHGMVNQTSWRGLPDFASKCSPPDTVGSSIRRPSWLETEDLYHLRLNRHRHRHKSICPRIVTNDTFMLYYIVLLLYAFVFIRGQSGQMTQLHVLENDWLFRSYFKLFHFSLESSSILPPGFTASRLNSQISGTWELPKHPTWCTFSILSHFSGTVAKGTQCIRYIYIYLWYVPKFCQKDFSVDIIPLRGSICFKYATNWFIFPRPIEMSSVSAKSPLQRSWP